MSQKTVAIVGVGPAIGMSLARRLGSEGYRVGLISRSQERLNTYVEELRRLNIDAAAFPADVKDVAGLHNAIASIEAHFGAIDVLEYSPLLDLYALVDVLSLTVENAREQVDFQLLGAIASVRAVMPQMIKRGTGALLFTLGASAYAPSPSHANGAIGVTALKRYAQMLHMALKPKGIYVGTLAIGRPPNPDEIAQIYWDKLRERKSCETLYGDPRYLGVYEHLIARGYATGYPPRLLKDLPEPVDESERNVFLISLFHIKEFVRSGQGGHSGAVQEAELDRLVAQAVRLGGKEHAAFFGADIDSAMRPIAGAL